MGRGKALHLERFPHELPGEDRSYGGNKFYVDLVPKSVWWANLRAMLPPSQWKALSSYAIHRADGACEICGAADRLEAHERWAFDESTGIQKLMRIVCVCKLCHLSIHIGLADAFGIREDIESHIFRLTLWGKREMKRHIKEARARWEVLSRRAWEVDASPVANAGLTPYNKSDVWRRVNEKRRKISEKIDGSRLTIDGMTWDFADPIFKECVVFIAETEKETLDGLPLSMGSAFASYTAKRPELIPPNRSKLDLKSFITAFRRSYGISNKAELTEAIMSKDGPKRLILSDEVDVETETITKGFSDGILFWGV